jgi:type I restriction enzyme R subunit
VHTKLSHATTREQDLGSGKKGQSVFFDSERPERNDFVVTRQYRLQGVKKQIVPDIVLFVNGIPLAVIECKSPTLGEKWRQEAIEQLLRYQEISDDYVELGMPRLFETVQLVATVCGQAACCWDAQRLPKMC